MRNRILIVEDDGNIYKMIQETFDFDFELVRARSVDEAIGEFVYNGPFDCFIIDLQIIATGLKEEEMVDNQGREGYALLKNYIWMNMSIDNITQMKMKTIICSRYVPDFRKEHSREELNGLAMIVKRTGFEKELRVSVENICKNKK